MQVSTPSISPSISIVITCYNYQEYVGRAIDSVLRQTRQDYELVVIDDGSTDGSWEAIQKYRVRAHRLANGGQRKACIFGVEQTTAPFILFLDADDELLPHCVEIVLAHLDDNVSKLQFPLLRIDGAGNVISKAMPPLKSFRSNTLGRSILRTGVYQTPPTSGNVFRRNLCSFLSSADYDRAVDGIMLFAAPFFGEVVSLSEELGLYRVHGRNFTNFNRGLDAKALQFDITRFEARLAQLQQILKPLGLDKKLIDATKTFYVLERSVYLDIANGSRVSIKRLLKLIVMLLRGQQPWRTKLSMSVFFIIAATLPNKPARRCVEYRLKASQRSLSGLFQAAMNR